MPAGIVDGAFNGVLAGDGVESALIDAPDSQNPVRYDPQRADRLAAEMPPMSATEQQRLSFLAATIEDILEPYAEQDLVEVKFSENRVMVDMKDKMLFPSGSARLSRAAAAMRVLSQEWAGSSSNRRCHMSSSS